MLPLGRPTLLYRPLRVDATKFDPALTMSAYDYTANVAAAEWASRATDPVLGIRANPDTTMFSKALGETVSVSVCLPIDYDSSGINYPVVYHLHGISGTNRLGSSFWQPRYQAARAAGVRPHITVWPNGLNWSMWADNFDGGNMMQRFLRYELPAWVHANYRTLGYDSRYNILTGFSMGMRGALALAFKAAAQNWDDPIAHPHWYGGVAGYAPPCGDSDTSFASMDAWGPPVVSPARTYTTTERAQWRSQSPHDWIDGYGDALSRVAIRVRYGSADGLSSSITSMLAQLDAESVPYDTPVGNLLAGITHSASAYWNDADALDTFAVYESVFAGS